MNRRVISVDPGYSSIKVVTKEKAVKIPFCLKKVSSQSEYERLVESEEYIIFRNNETNESWLVGEYAVREALQTSSDIPNTYFTRNRFKTEENKIAILTGIAVGMLDENNNFSKQKTKPLVTVGLPHKFESDVRDSVREQITNKTHNFSLKFGNKPFIDFNLRLDNEDFATISQTVGAFLSRYLYDDGSVKDAELENKSVLVLDGGFLTLGILPMANMHPIEIQSESNTSLSMVNVYRRAAEDIRKETRRSDIQFWNLDLLKEKNGGVIEYDQGRTMNINEVIEHYTEQCALDTIKHINASFDNCYGFDKIIVTGGTGRQYMPYLEKAYKGKCILSDGDETRRFDPVFAIAVGCYRAGVLHLKQQEALEEIEEIETVEEVVPSQKRSSTK